MIQTLIVGLNEHHGKKCKKCKNYGMYEYDICYGIVGKLDVSVYVL